MNVGRADKTHRETPGATARQCGAIMSLDGGGPVPGSLIAHELLVDGS